DHRPCPEGLAARAALDQKSELGPFAGPGLGSRTKISEALSSRPADRMDLGEVGGVGIHCEGPSCAKPHRQTLDGGRGDPAVAGAVHLEHWRQRAHREAIGLLQREPVVKRRLPTRDYQSVLKSY